MQFKTLFTPNFTLLILGQVSSLLGNFTLKFALSLYILDQTGSAAVFASILAFATVPTILLSPFGGILADRANRKRIMVGLDLASGVTVLVSALCFLGQGGLQVLGAMLIILSVLGAFESPTVQACIPQMQPPERLVAANAVVNQVAAVASLITPILGGLLYTRVSMRAILWMSAGCFLLTAALECLIRLQAPPAREKQPLLQLVRTDLRTSFHFIFRTKPDLLRLLLLAAAATFFIMGIASVGLPFTVRTVLGLSAEHYAVAEVFFGVAAIGGSLCAGLLRLRLPWLCRLLLAVGLCMLPPGIAFFLAAGPMACYWTLIVCVCIMQFLVCIFSIFALSCLQQMTPPAMLGRVMSYVSALTLCAQPLGQAIYGALFDILHTHLFLVFLPTGCLLGLIALLSRSLFCRLSARAQPE